MTEVKQEKEIGTSRLELLASNRFSAQLPSHLEKLEDNTQQEASDNHFTSFLQNEYSIFAIEPGEGRSAVEMYVEVAVDALNSIEHVDPTASRSIRQVIDYLVNCTEANPRGLDDALLNIEDLSMRNSELERQVCDLEFHEEFLKAENDGLKDRLVVVEDMMTKYEMDNEKKDSELREVKKRTVQLDEFLEQERNNAQHNKTIRNAAVMRQNELSAQLMEEMNGVERLKIKLKNLEFRNKELNDQTIDQTIEIDQMREQINEEELTRKELEAKKKEEIGDLEVENVKFRNRVDVLGEQLDKKDNTISNLQQQIKALNFNLEQLKAAARGQNRPDNISKNFDGASQYMTGKKQRLIIQPGVEVEVRNAGIQVNVLREKINPNFRFKLVNPEDEDPEVMARMHIEDLSEDSDSDLCDELEQIQQEYEEKHPVGSKSTKQRSLAILEELQADPPDFEEIVDPRETEKIRAFLSKNCCTRQQLHRHLVAEQLLKEKYRKYKFEYTMQGMELEYLQRQVKCEEIQQIILNLDQVLKKSLENANGTIKQGSEFERTLQYLEDMKKQLFTKLQQADEEDLKYMLLLTQARKLTTQIEDNLAKPNLDNLSDITGVNSTFSPETETVAPPLTDDFLHTIVKQITNVLGRAKRAPRKREQFVNFDDFCKEIQPDLVIRKQQHNIQSVAPKFNIAQQVLGARANASKANIQGTASKLPTSQFDRPVIREKVVEKVIEKVVEKIVEKVVEKPVFVDRPVYIEKVIEKPILQYVDRTVERIVYKPLEPDTENSHSNNTPPAVIETTEMHTETTSLERCDKQVEHQMQDKMEYVSEPLSEAREVDSHGTETDIVVYNSSIAIETAFMQQQFTIEKAETAEKAVEKECVITVESINMESTAMQTDILVNVSEVYHPENSLELESSQSHRTYEQTEIESSQSEHVVNETLIEDNEPTTTETPQEIIIPSKSVAIEAEFRMKTRNVGVYVGIEQPCQRCAQLQEEMVELRLQPKEPIKSGDIKPQVYQYEDIGQVEPEERISTVLYQPDEQQSREIFMKVQANTDEFVDTLARNFKGKDGAIVQGTTKLMISKFIEDQSKQAVGELVTIEQKARNYLENQLQRVQEEASQSILKQSPESRNLSTTEKAESHTTLPKEFSRQLSITQFMTESQASIEAAVAEKEVEQQQEEEKIVQVIVPESSGPLLQRPKNKNQEIDVPDDNRDQSKAMLARASMRKSLRFFNERTKPMKEEEKQDFITTMEQDLTYSSEAEREKAATDARIVREALAAYTQKSDVNGIISVEETVTFAGAAASISLKFLRDAQDREADNQLHEDALRYNGELIRLPTLDAETYEIRGTRFISPYASAIRFRKRYLQALKANNATVFKYLSEQQRNVEIEQGAPELLLKPLRAPSEYENQDSKLPNMKGYRYETRRPPCLVGERLRIADVSLLASKNSERAQRLVDEGDSVYWLLIVPWMQQLAAVLQEIKCRPRVFVKVPRASETAHDTEFRSSSDLYYIQMPDNILIKPVQWLIRFIRQLYYELDHEQIYALRRRVQAITFAQILYHYVLQKVGIQEQSTLLCYTVLCCLQYNLLNTSCPYSSELQLFAGFISGDLSVDELLFAKYCRSLFPLDDQNPAVLPLQQAVRLHSYSTQQIIDKIGIVFQIDPNALARFANQQFCLADDAIMHVVMYNNENRITLERSIAQQFNSRESNGILALHDCLAILQRIRPTMTEERLKELLEDQNITLPLFIEIYKQLLSAPQDTLRREVWIKVQGLDRIALENNIVDDKIEEMREDCLFWFESGKLLRARSLADAYERYVVGHLFSQTK